MHQSAELLSHLFTEAVLNALLRPACHTKHVPGQEKQETFPTVPSQPCACSPVTEFLGPQI